MRERLYTHDAYPDHWITDHEDGVTLIEWPATGNGWAQRRTYTGPREALIEHWPKHAVGTGWPGAVACREPPFEARSSRRPSA